MGWAFGPMYYLISTGGGDNAMDPQPNVDWSLGLINTDFHEAFSRYNHTKIFPSISLCLATFLS
jgi:hypothetical protein